MIFSCSQLAVRGGDADKDGSSVGNGARVAAQLLLERKEMHAQAALEN